MLHQLTCEQVIRADRKTVWNYISDPGNLASITPAYMGFAVLNKPASTIYPGQIIEYRVKPLLGIPLRWTTEITHVKENDYFVDEQRFGPYSFWHHQHHLVDVEGGLLMRDIVHYKIPFGFAGKLANQILVKRQLAGIFSYRRNKFEQLFNQDK